MSAGTINSYLKKTITLGTKGYMDSLTITNTGEVRAPEGRPAIYSSLSTGEIYNQGKIIGGFGSGDDTEGAPGVVITGAASLINAGTIIGGSSMQYNNGNGVQSTGFVDNLATGFIEGGTRGIFSYVAGSGIDLRNATLNNAGTISGGYGYGSNGGNGVLGSGYILNTGTITGAPADYHNINYEAGYGVYLRGGLNNSGIISGGGGIAVLIELSSNTFLNSGTVVAAYVGVQMQGTGTIINQGTIMAENVSTGGIGLKLLGSATVIDSGLISGGTINQGTADAIEFGTFADTLIVDPGAVFVGNVVANAAYADVLEVAGSSSVVFGGIGTQFTGFDDIAFASLAVRTIAGDVAGLAAGQTISGFAGHDQIILDGFSAAGAALTTSGVELISSGTTAVLDVVLAASKNIVVSETDGNTTLAAPAGTVTLTSGETELTASGGSSHNTRIDGGGTLTVYAGGTASTPTIAGGDLILNAGADFSGAVRFTGTGGLLAIGGTVMPTNVISGFVAGDTIQLTGVTYQAGATASVSSRGHVVIHDGSTTEKLNIAGTTLGEPLVFGPGSDLTVGTAAMAFMAPETAAAAAVHENWFGGSVMVETPVAVPLFVSSAVHFGAVPHLVETVHKGGVQGFVVLPRE